MKVKSTYDAWATSEVGQVAVIEPLGSTVTSPSLPRLGLKLMAASSPPGIANTGMRLSVNWRFPAGR